MNINEAYRTGHPDRATATAPFEGRTVNVRLSKTDLAFVRLLSSVLKEPEMTIAARLIGRRREEAQAR